MCVARNYAKYISFTFRKGHWIYFRLEDPQIDSTHKDTERNKKSTQIKKIKARARLIVHGLIDLESEFPLFPTYSGMPLEVLKLESDSI